MRIRLLHTFFYPSNDAVSQIISEIAFHLASQGHHVEAIASQGRYGGGGRALPGQQTISGVRVRRCWGPSLGKRSLLARVADNGSYLMGSLAKALLGPRCDVTVVLSSPPMYHALAPLIRRVGRSKLVFVVMDLYPDIAVRAGMLREGSGLHKFLARLTKRSLIQADQIVVLGRCMAERIRQYGVPEEQIAIVENWAIGQDIHPIDPDNNPLRRQLGYDDKFVVMYSGNMGVGHRFDDILTAAENLRHRSNIRFCFAGGGVRRRQIQAAQTERNLENIDLLDYAPRQQLARSLGIGDAHFVSLREGFEGLIVPSKTYGILAAGRPILFQGNPGGEIARIIRDQGLGFAVPPGDAGGLTEAIEAWAANRQWAREQGNRCREIFESRYTRAKGLAKYQQVFEALAARTHA